jgi:alpha-ketoglutarate-dependent taurine dioxygenase
MGVEVCALPEPFGAIVEGWSPDHELDAADRETIGRALRRYLVLVFRGDAPRPMRSWFASRVALVS